MSTDNMLLSVRELKKHFPIRRGLLQSQTGAIRAVDGVSFDIRAGETLGLVGESGCGKSTLGRTMLLLQKPSSGKVLLDGTDLAEMEPGILRKARRQMQIIFQDPYASLNPRMRIDRIIREPLDIHHIGEPADRADRVLQLLNLVGLDASHATRYPHEFSGGQRQRIGIARALATSPAFIVADEPISSLDVSIQAQIVNLLMDLKEQLGLTYLFIAHDLAMVRHISDRVAVMYLGRIVELGNCDDVFGKPLHPYTRALIDAIPIADPQHAKHRPHTTLQGDIPDPAAPPSGCNFRTRCSFASSLCRQIEPELRNLYINGGAVHQVACHHAESLDNPSNDTRQEA